VRVGAVLRCAPQPAKSKRIVQVAMLALGAGDAGVAVLGMTALGSSGAIPSGLLGETVVEVAPAVLVFFLVALLYRFVPNRRLDWSEVWGPALAVAIGQEVLKTLFFARVHRHYARYDAVYGSLGVAVVAMIWPYANAVLFLLGAEAAAGERAPIGELAERASETTKSGARLARRLERAGG
jgi:YihY family inner membrane protein